jgi:hypothetical protein
MRANCLPNVRVAIHVNGNALPEHHADSEDGKTSLCYVEAVSGAEFSLVSTTKPGYANPKESPVPRLSRRQSSKVDHRHPDQEGQHFIH